MNTILRITLFLILGFALTQPALLPTAHSAPLYWDIYPPEQKEKETRMIARSNRSKSQWKQYSDR